MTRPCQRQDRAQATTQADSSCPRRHVLWQLLAVTPHLQIHNWASKYHHGVNTLTSIPMLWSSGPKSRGSSPTSAPLLPARPIDRAECSVPYPRTLNTQLIQPSRSGREHDKWCAPLLLRVRILAIARNVAVVDGARWQHSLNVSKVS